MNMVDLIETKKAGKELSAEEIQFIVKGFTEGNIPDYQMSAWLMAVCLKGMTMEETVVLTGAMIDSGKTIDLSSIPGICCDKHSTGGVGDKTTLILAPLMAACGLYIAKMSGRGLGHTGGTIDKLESIPGFHIELSMEQFLNQVKSIHLAVIGQSDELVLADKKMYALRDVTGTVDAIPLIASSIMSKKLASGTKVIVLDVKYGKGAFMKTEEDATELGSWMEQLGHAHGVKVEAIISPMNQPLGYAIGNQLEVIEAIHTLQNKGPQDLLDTCLELGTSLIINSGVLSDETKAHELMLNKIEDGSAYEYFEKFIKAQGGDLSHILDINIPSKEFRATKDGAIDTIDAIAIGKAAMLLGAGRQTKADVIDYQAGIVLKLKENDVVKQGDTIAVLYSQRSFDQAIELLNNGIVIKES